MSYRDRGVGITGASAMSAAGGGGSAPRLLDQVRDRIRVKHYSLKTEAAYCGWIRRFILANGKRHPREMGGPEVEAFLSRLAAVGTLTPTTTPVPDAAGTFVIYVDGSWHRLFFVLQTITRAHIYQFDC